MEPVLPILQEIEQERVPHFNETYSWPLFVRVLVYHFTMGYQSMRELVTGLRHADAALALPALPRSTVSQMFTRFDSDLLHRALVRLLNGMITNDKFCCTRWGELQLSWWRRPLRLRQ
jgi:hypothetical protein